MSDKTIMKPRPGGRGAPLPEIPRNPAFDNDKTRIASMSSTSGKTGNSVQSSGVKNGPILGVSNNAIVDAAGTILSLISKIRNANTHHNTEELKQKCSDLIKHYEQALRKDNIEASLIDAARYSLCSFIDETVLNTTWGSESDWGFNSLLSTFHHETIGGEYFYTLLDESLADPQRRGTLLELQYLCLSLGFVGKMRVAEHGQEQINDYRERCYQTIRRLYGEYERELSSNWRRSLATGIELQASFPIWVIVCLFSAIVLGIYMTFNYNLNLSSEPTLNNIQQLVPAKVNAIDQVSGQTRDEYVRLQQLLQTEIQRKLLSVTQLPDRVRIRIASGDIFPSGEAFVQESYEPILQKIASSVEGSKGKLLITGHTDDTPIATSKYPSNWNLSLARATAVSNFLSQNSHLEGRLWPEGKGDSEPIMGNDSAQNRAINRRIEIDLLH